MNNILDYVKPLVDEIYRREPDYDNNIVVLEGVYDTQEDAEKQAFDNSRLSIVPRNKPCDIGLN